MKIALAQINTIIGAISHNREKIVKFTKEAAEKGAEIVIFPELALCGYPPTDQLYFDLLEEELQILIEQTQDLPITVIVGTITEQSQGKPYNSLVIFRQGKILHRYHKVLLPDYDIFDENRYFAPGTPAKPVEINGRTIGLTICEDIWITDPDLKSIYASNPLEEIKGVDLVINISGSPFSIGHPARRLNVITETARITKSPVAYVNHVGAQTDLIFDGRSCIVYPDGTVESIAPAFEESLIIAELKGSGSFPPFVGEPWIEDIYDALVIGIRDFFRKLGLKHAYVGLSGGIDSSVVCALAVEALGKESVTGVLMPSEFTSRESIEDALQLAENLGIKTFNLPITQPFHNIVKVLQDRAWKDKPFDVTEENIQSRIRMIYLHALTNKLGGAVLNTSNKSELATGYGTLYGDMSGALGVLGDVYKTWVYRLARVINQRLNKAIPERVLTKPPSAELRPNQTDQDTLPPYDVLDTVLIRYIEMHETAAQIAKATGIDLNTVNNIINMVNRNEYKRYQAPPILRVTNKAFGIGRRMPIVGRFKTAFK